MWLQDEVSYAFKTLQKCNNKIPVDITLRKYQLKSVCSILNRRDLICSLPTAGGKTFCMILPAIIDSFINNNSRRVTIIVSPLESLMADQESIILKYGYFVKIFNKVEIPQTQTWEDFTCLPDNGPCFILMSPETACAITDKTKFFDLMDPFHVCIDEGHCVFQWGEIQSNGEPAFRQSYGELYNIRSHTAAPFGLYTATITAKMLPIVQKSLCVIRSKVDYVIHAPDRPNLFLKMVSGKSKDLNQLQFLVDDIRKKHTNADKAIIFVNQATEAHELFYWFRQQLDESFRLNNSTCHLERTVGMYTASVATQSKAIVAKKFGIPENNMRILVATVAFGMGIDIPFVRRVVIWGLPRDFVTLWQQAGRCSRDGQQGSVYIFPFKHRHPQATYYDDLSFQENTCIRQTILSKFLGYTVEGNAANSCTLNCQICECRQCRCCSVCQMSCDCRVRVHV
ncbi:unnamed protein product [Allacma fusca]|uniref:DNA 3'-5' helicase n=1 Tax=Allacma fusca TaxID=39272 RepID=A0A8J2NL51_9HEXA|nr:unnamed protein product [Allacma fusca]